MSRTYHDAIDQPTLSEREALVAYPSMRQLLKRIFNGIEILDHVYWVTRVNAKGLRTTAQAESQIVPSEMIGTCDWYTKRVWDNFVFITQEIRADVNSIPQSTIDWNLNNLAILEMASRLLNIAYKGLLVHAGDRAWKPSAVGDVSMTRVADFYSILHFRVFNNRNAMWEMVPAPWLAAHPRGSDAYQQEQKRFQEMKAESNRAWREGDDKMEQYDPRLQIGLVVFHTANNSLDQATSPGL